MVSVAKTFGTALEVAQIKLVHDEFGREMGGTTCTWDY